MNQRGFGLSVNFLVILILCIVIFGFSLALIGKFINFACKAQGTITAEMEKELQERMIRGERVALPKNFIKSTVNPTETEEFMMGITNTFSSKKRFLVKIGYEKEYDSKDETIVYNEGDPTHIDQNWMFSTFDYGLLTPTENKIQTIPIRIGPEMAAGVPTKKDRIYEFNICVFVDGDGVKFTEDGSIVDVTTPCNMDTPRDMLYTKRIYKLRILAGDSTGNSWFC